MLLFSIVLLLVLLFIGMPIGFVLLFVGSFGIFFSEGYNVLHGILATTAYRSVNNFTFSAIPLFIVMAHFISKSKVADDIFDSMLKWVGHTPGGAGVATVLASGGFGALTGTSIAATAVMSQIAVPKMIQARYPESIASGLVATSTGTLAALIPPSVPLILYGIQTENSIGQLLVAGILPGLLLAFLLCITVVAIGLKNNIKTEKYTWKERWMSLKTIWPAILLIVLVLIVIYFGIATTTEAAAFGAVGALVIGLALKRLNAKQIIDSLMTTARQTAMIFTIIVGAHVFSYYIAMTRVGNDILNAISLSGFSPLTVLLLIFLMYLILGMFMDLIGTMLLTLPLVYPLIVGLGYDPIWFGVVLVLLLEIGLVTPPVGMNLFITNQNSGVPVNKVLIGSIPFIIVLLLLILILVIFPQLATYLPSLM
ncbi:TRAP transporter large permease [Oceanobacillus saliphilus]|uniref:TRAP transporter large permease n=1 Tax=Oceanobacillus saliphilus TaxID=2925834 RepID=UPI00201DD9FD|nr:TRAP transporter large permease [Oceanobacillus saliphilus]